MKHSIGIALFIFLFAACTAPSPYEGYKKSKKGFYYQLQAIGETEQNINTGDYVTVDIEYTTLSDSLFFKGRRKIKLESPAYPGAIEDCISSIHMGDKASFIIDAEPFFKQSLETNLPSFLNVTDKIKINIGVVEVQTEENYLKDKQAFLHWTEDFGEYEKVVLQQYISEKKLDVTQTQSGLVYLPITEGNGKKVEVNDTVTIHYEGIFLNGKYFDSTKRRKQPFQFIYGTEWQVIEGIEEGLKYMTEGEKALFIVPSKLAFGAVGSSTGIVPPFTSLVFEVELLEIKKADKSDS